MAQSSRTEEGERRTWVKVAENRASMTNDSTMWTILSLYVLWEARSMTSKAWIHSSALEYIYCL